MFRLKVRSVGMISAVLLAMIFVVPSSAALASGKSCQGEPNGPLTTCMYVNGSGLHINYAQGSVFKHLVAEGERALGKLLRQLLATG